MQTVTTNSAIIGHEARWVALARAFAKNEIPQSLLFSGPPQIGKWTLARRYAQLLLCPTPILENGLPAPCGACRVCHQVEIETFPDFKVYRPLVSSAEDERDWVFAPKAMSSSVLPISVARKFGGEAMRKPLVGPRKVMILVQADRMTDDAQNALLKTFEEPVPGLSIFLLCDNADKLLPTILSRCWNIPLGFAADAQIADWLRAGSTPEAAMSEEQIAIAVRAARGRPGVAKNEIARLQYFAQNSAEETVLPRPIQAEAFLAKLLSSAPLGALALTEEALRLAKDWWDEDQSVAAQEGSAPGAAGGKKELKKGDAKIVRSSVALFLDELAGAYRARWTRSVLGGAGSTPKAAQQAARWSAGLDQIRKTRHYILRNANTNLALDVLFGRLIAGR
jgi:DNA polymerase III delta prime subunit